jgi:hypothetical protein
MSTVTIQREIEVADLIDMILDDGINTDDILARLDNDDIKDYLEEQGYLVISGNKEEGSLLSRSNIIRIVRQKNPPLS